MGTARSDASDTVALIQGTFVEVDKTATEANQRLEDARAKLAKSQADLDAARARYVARPSVDAGTVVQTAAGENELAQLLYTSAADAAEKANRARAGTLEALEAAKLEVLKVDLRLVASAATFHQEADPHVARLLDLVMQLAEAGRQIDLVVAKNLAASAELRRLGDATPDLDAVHVLQVVLEALAENDIMPDDIHALRYQVIPNEAKGGAIGKNIGQFVTQLLELLTKAPTPSRIEGHRAYLRRTRVTRTHHQAMQLERDELAAAGDVNELAGRARAVDRRLPPIAADS